MEFDIHTKLQNVHGCASFFYRARVMLRFSDSFLKLVPNTASDPSGFKVRTAHIIVNTTEGRDMPDPLFIGCNTVLMPSL
jgi:hypothetical protein